MSVSLDKEPETVVGTVVASEQTASQRFEELAVRANNLEYQNAVLSGQLSDARRERADARALVARQQRELADVLPTLRQEMADSLARYEENSGSEVPDGVWAALGLERPTQEVEVEVVMRMTMRMLVPRGVRNPTRLDVEEGFTVEYGHGQARVQATDGWEILNDPFEYLDVTVEDVTGL